jgi:hypothetical protein
MGHVGYYVHDVTRQNTCETGSQEITDSRSDVIHFKGSFQVQVLQNYAVRFSVYGSVQSPVSNRPLSDSKFIFNFGH